MDFFLVWETTELSITAVINDQSFIDSDVMLPKQEACGVTGEFPLASATWWSPGTTCRCRRRRISTTDTRWAVNAE